MAEQFCCCPFCNAPLALKSGGYAYMRSQVVEHMTLCDRKPPNLTKEEFWALVDRATSTEHMP